MNVMWYDANGKIQGTAHGVSAEEAAAHPLNAQFSMLECEDHIRPSTHFVQNAAVVEMPQEVPGHVWDWTTRSWQEDLAGAIAARKKDVEREFGKEMFAPILYDLAQFDADSVARGRISGVLARLQRGDGLPAGWVGWRDADNQMHWSADAAETVQMHLAQLAKAIEDREQSLLLQAWNHKASIGSFETVSEVLAYPISFS